jgi:hypothetical protein
MSEQPTPKAVAFVLDGKAVDVLYTDDRMAAILLSNPTIVDVTGPIVNLSDGSIGITSTANTGDLYDENTGLFTRPE